MKIFQGIYFLFFLLCPAMAQAQFNPMFEFEYGSLPTEALRETRTKALTLKELRQSKNYIERDSKCSTFFDLAGSSKKDLIALNHRFAGKATRAYQKQFNSLKARNAKAQREYKDCFVSFLERNRGRYPNIHKQILLNHTSHRARMEQLDVDFDKINDGDLELLITDLTARLRADLVQQAGNYAVVSASSGDLEYQRNGEGPWLKAPEGHTLGINDTIRTNADAVARLSFKTSQDSPTAAELNLSSNTEVKISDFNSSESETSVGAIDLFQGMIRATKRTLNTFKKSKYAQGALFSTRAGTTIAGGRGTEWVMSYDPGTGKTDIHFDHGTGFVKAGGREIALQPKTSVTVQNEQISEAKPLSQNFWDNLVSQTTPQESGAGSNTGGATEKNPVLSPRIDNPVYAAWTAKVKFIDTVLEEIDPNRNPRKYGGLQDYRWQMEVVDRLMGALRFGDRNTYYGLLTFPTYAIESKPEGQAALDQIRDIWEQKEFYTYRSCIACNAETTQCTVLSQLHNNGLHEVYSLVDLEQVLESRFPKISSYQISNDAQKHTFMQRNPVCQ